MSLNGQFSCSIFLSDVRAIHDRLVINSCHYRFASPFSLFYFLYPASSRYNAFNNHASLFFSSHFFTSSPLHPMNREGPRNYVTLPLLVSHSSPSFFTRIDTPFHPLTHNLLFSKSGAERSLIAILNRNRSSNSFESTFYQFSNKKLNRPSFFFPPLIFSILIRRN